MSDKMREALEYWRDHCSGAEPSVSVFARMADEALAQAEQRANDDGLLPCPFCGGEASRSTGKKATGEPWPYIECGDCEAMAEPKVWNRRPAQAEQRGEVIGTVCWSEYSASLGKTEHRFYTERDSHVPYGTPLYTAPPAPDGAYKRGFKEGHTSGWNAGASADAPPAPVVPDDAECERILNGKVCGDPIRKYVRGGTLAAGLDKADVIRAIAAMLAAPTVAAPVVPDDVAKDAERFRWLRRLDAGGIQVYDGNNDASVFGNDLDAAIDAAMLAAAPTVAAKGAES